VPDATTSSDPRQRQSPFPLTFYGVRESTPGPQWRAVFDATSPAYRAWYLKDTPRPRPTLRVARQMLTSHMPELVPTWERLTELTEGDETMARLLTLWNPPAFLSGCSQAVLHGDTPVLVRNYDYRPDLCERVVYSSALTGRRVLGMSDCLWGLLDGMNDAGLAVSLTFGGRAEVGEGFGIPLVLRYLLEVTETLAEATAVLSRLPVSMAYNVTVLDRNADAATVFVAPGERPEVTRIGAVANHRGTTPDWPDHARAFRSVERQQALLRALAARPTPEALVDQLLRPPLYTTAYDRGFGTLYTAAYRPAEGVADFVWPSSTWRRTFDSPSGTHEAVLGVPREDGQAPTAPGQQPPYDRGNPLAEGFDGTRRVGQARFVPSSRPTAPVTPSEHRTPDDLAEAARAALRGLARSDDPAAFAHLLRLSAELGECLGVSARQVAGSRSWSGVADLAGTTRQAAWARWGRH
jgi:predicted choloylglycine hydrolase